MFDVAKLIIMISAALKTNRYLILLKAFIKEIKKN